MATQWQKGGRPPPGPAWIQTATEMTFLELNQVFHSGCNLSQCTKLIIQKMQKKKQTNKQKKTEKKKTKKKKQAVQEVNG